MYTPVYFEQWKRIAEFEPDVKDQYLISNFGNVFSEVIHRYLIPAINNGYLNVQLAMKNGKRVTFSIHRLVGKAFIENYYPFSYNDLIINHINKNRSDNFFKNLEWATCKYNMWHSFNYPNDEKYIAQAENTWGKTSYGDENGMSRLTTPMVHEICKCLENNVSYDEILLRIGLEINNINRHLLYQISRGARWKHISSLYNFEYRHNKGFDYKPFVESICSLLQQGYRICDINNMLHMSDNKENDRIAITRIKSRHIFTDISKNYIW